MVEESSIDYATKLTFATSSSLEESKDVDALSSQAMWPFSLFFPSFLSFQQVVF